MELLDKGMKHNKKIKQAKLSIVYFLFIMVIGIVLGRVLIGSSNSSMNMCIAMMVGVGIIIALLVISYHKRAIIKIDEITDVFLSDVVTTKVISKSIESYIENSTKYHDYIVSARTIDNKTIIIYSKDLYMSINKGEYVDILVKEKLDKNRQLVDSSYIPLMDTIKSRI